jgi:RES domain
MDKLDLKIRKFEALSPTEITVDEIVARLRPIMHGYRVVGTLCFPPLSIYRARRASGFPRWNQVRDLSYPKSGSGFDQRANRKGVKIFYGASSADLALAEIDA